MDSKPDSRYGGPGSFPGREGYYILALQFFEDSNSLFIETLIAVPSVEEFFCTGNLRETAINIFLQHTNAIYFVLS